MATEGKFLIERLNNAINLIAFGTLVLALAFVAPRPVSEFMLLL